MFGKRCSLCGGKLVNNKCTLCGLDNSKSDANYKVNVSRCDKMNRRNTVSEQEKMRKENRKIMRRSRIRL